MGLGTPPCMLKFVTKAEHNRLHNTGKHRSDETRRKMSEANRRRTFSDETRKKISEAMKSEKNPFYSKHLSEEIRNKISEAMKGRTLSEDHRRKISEAAKRRWAAVNR